ncbi:phenylacetic acid degradation protein [Candidatus Leptofilum sp.]|uniref:phenylacetic acid degradation protein n=1 Tax=Candidatus Leptofilum sp. TaxID=3241576 RepID=UPI003B58DF3B
MSDTQWPRYEVFKQDNPKKRHEAVGSVHAPDAELALQNGRDVFVRRPSAVSLWVVQADAIFMMTREELEANPDFWVQVWKVDGTPTLFHIFTKTSQRRSMTYVRHVGQIEAVTPELALRDAIESGNFDADNVWVWWVVADEFIHRSNENDIEALFAPALDKTYRQQSHYGFVSPRRQQRGRQEK